MSFFGIGLGKRPVRQSLKQIVLGNACPSGFNAQAAAIKISALARHLRIYGIAQEHLFAGAYKSIKIVDPDIRKKADGLYIFANRSASFRFFRETEDLFQQNEFQDVEENRDLVPRNFRFCACGGKKFVKFFSRADRAAQRYIIFKKNVGPRIFSRSGQLSAFEQGGRDRGGGTFQKIGVISQRRGTSLRAVCRGKRFFHLADRTRKTRFISLFHIASPKT